MKNDLQERNSKSLTFSNFWQTLSREINTTVTSYVNYLNKQHSCSLITTYLYFQRNRDIFFIVYDAYIECLFLVLREIDFSVYRIFFRCNKTKM